MAKDIKSLEIKDISQERKRLWRDEKQVDEPYGHPGLLP